MHLYLILVYIALAHGAPSEVDQTSANESNKIPRESSEGRIVGGELYSIEYAPYQISLTHSNRHLCGGSIVDTEHVVTAAHCVAFFSLSNLAVNAGTEDIRIYGSVHKVMSAIIHHKYELSSRGVPKHDIAVIKVSPPFTFNNKIKPVSLATTKPIVGQHVTITGYGTISEKGPISYRLRAITVPVYNKKLCNKAYIKAGSDPIGNEYFCAGLAQGYKDSCQGDSGGPVVTDGKLIGVVSYGHGCARPSTPGVYTDISYYQDWLRDALRNRK